MPKALITGVTGQDGSYLSELLLEKGYEVHGLVRRTSTLERSRIDHLFHDPEIYNKRFFLHYGDLTDPTTMRRVLFKLEPDEIYHLAGQTHVGLSFEIPESTCEMTALGALRILELVRDLSKQPRFFHAASSEIFGIPKAAPQNEETPIAPVNPYGCSKAFATQIVGVYRRSFGLFGCNGILYNHESPRRGENFVTRKICRAAAAIKAGKQRELSLGDTSARRDWGHAKDYVRGMWLTLQHNAPEDFIFATGITHSVQDVIEIAFKTAGLKWQDHLKRDERFMRPTESASLVGDPSKAESVLGWKREYTFEQIIAEMTEHEMAAIELSARK